MSTSEKIISHKFYSIFIALVTLYIIYLSFSYEGFLFYLTLPLSIFNLICGLGYIKIKNSLFANGSSNPTCIYLYNILSSMLMLTSSLNYNKDWQFISLFVICLIWVCFNIYVMIQEGTLTLTLFHLVFSILFLVASFQFTDTKFTAFFVICCLWLAAVIYKLIQLRQNKISANININVNINIHHKK